jgi:hypothetical protein
MLFSDLCNRRSVSSRLIFLVVAVRLRPTKNGVPSRKTIRETTPYGLAGDIAKTVPRVGSGWGHMNMCSSETKQDRTTTKEDKIVRRKMIFLRRVGTFLDKVCACLDGENDFPDEESSDLNAENGFPLKGQIKPRQGVTIPRRRKRFP